VTKVLAALILAAPVSQAAPRYDAGSNFAIHCMGCHRADGRGSPPEVPSLVQDLPWMLRISAGREYVIRVPGVAGSSLTDPETTAILNWILEMIVPRSDGAPIARFTDTEVTAARHRPLLDVRAERARLFALRSAMEKRP
jgi:mono/diheme cytochrome c family protein